MKTLWSKMGRNAVSRTDVPSAGRLPEPGLNSQNPHLLPWAAKRSRPLPLVAVKCFAFSRQRLYLFFLISERLWSFYLCPDVKVTEKKQQMAAKSADSSKFFPFFSTQT